MTKIKVSFSALDTYNKCPRKYYYNYVLQLPRKDWTWLKLGSFVHLVLEKFHKYIIYFKKRDREIKYGYLMRRAFDSSVSKYDRMKDSISIEMQDEARDILRKYLEKVREHCPNVLFTEKWFEIEIDGFLLRGSIDRVDELGDGDYNIEDYKTSKRAHAVNKTHQLTIYSYALRKILNKPIKKLKKTLNFLRLNKINSVMDQDSDVDSAINFVKNTGEAIVENLNKSRNDENGWAAKESALCRFCDFQERCFSNRGKNIR